MIHNRYIDSSLFAIILLCEMFVFQSCNRSPRRGRTERCPPHGVSGDYFIKEPYTFDKKWETPTLRLTFDKGKLIGRRMRSKPEVESSAKNRGL